MTMRKELSAQVESLLHQFDFKAKKRLGQHFLVDEDVLERILSAAELGCGDTVVEIGPGLGVLTGRLAEMVREVIAVELDSKLVRMLRGILASSHNVRIVHTDILAITPGRLLEIYSAMTGSTQNYKVVANLPYNVSSPVIRHFLTASLKPSLMVVMVQREVGDAMAAVPGKMSLLSVATQFYSKPTIITYVPAASFYPAPKVKSAVLRLDVYGERPVKVSDVEKFFDIVSCGFRAPRKQIRNSLAQALGMPASQIASLLEEAGILDKRRAETLNMEEWKKLWEVLSPFR